jgi:GntR family transcriptional repressor for pyruvate dehydrogenase complex
MTAATPSLPRDGAEGGGPITLVLDPAAFTPIEDRRESLSTKIVKVLVSYLFSGDVLVGSKLPSERVLAESLGVSRSAVRDAIGSLDLLGVLDIRQGDGTYFRGCSDLLPQVIEWGLLLKEQRIWDLVETRQHTEETLAGLAAKRRTKEQLAEIGLLLDAMDDEQDRDAFVDLDIAFHLAIADASANTVMRDILSNVTSLLRVWMVHSINAAGETPSSNVEHRVIYDAIVAGKSGAARTAMRKHLAAAETRLRRALEIRPVEI